MRYAIIGCGDVGQRIIKELQQNGVNLDSIVATVGSVASLKQIEKLGVRPLQVDLDRLEELPDELKVTNWVYLVPPQKSGVTDQRAFRLTGLLESCAAKPENLVVISTTGVYGDAAGEWVDESTPTHPKTERGLRRLDMEQRWLAWAERNEGVKLRILRVPGIYAHSRIPLQRLQKSDPVVCAEECGFTNRIHADDLARACVAALEYTGEESLFNISDGYPGTITDYLQAAAEVAGLSSLPEISMAEAKEILSPAMLSYLSESRKIDNRKMREELKVAPLFTDFREGLRH